MTSYEAPAKLNLSLLVSPPRSDGYHPLESLVQTIEWCDHLLVDLGEEGVDTFESDIEDNLVAQALAELRKTAQVPPLALELIKEIPVAAGLGGGSSDAAAALLAGSDFGEIDQSNLPDVAHRVGADVTLFLTGGTLMIRGVGYEIESLRPLDDFAVAVVVPDFGLVTKDVYQRWDTLEGPEGASVPDERLPPSLRGGMPMRNDLLPAAVDLEPRLGDFMADISSVWGTTVGLTGSGSACFGFFATLDEATDAATAVTGLTREARGVTLRPTGVTRVDDRVDDAS
ncbi:MAG: 4-(cytidine 5'-diphospho)-2-C-methyl-D-erythritol kinase [Actinomycetota bacterium]